MIREFSAGGVCVRRMRGRDYVAAVRVKRGTVLALPKGHIDPGESAAEAVQVLNFYSAVFADQLKRGRKTATIRLGDKSHKYRKNQVVLVTIGYQHSPREKIFEAVVDQVEVKRIKELSPRDIEHDNPEFRRTEEMIHFLSRSTGARWSSTTRSPSCASRRSSIPRRSSPTGCAASAECRTSR